MSSRKQIEANRNNAKQSTGPRTNAGKQRSSQNALQHGLLAKQTVIPGENPADFEALLSSYEDTFQPSNPVEDRVPRPSQSERYWPAQAPDPPPNRAVTVRERSTLERENSQPPSKSAA